MRRDRAAITRREPAVAKRPRNRQRRRRRSCLPLAVLAILALILTLGGLSLVGYGLWEQSARLPRTTILLLGIDRRPGQGDVVRSDTLMLVTLYPPGPQVALLSIPRDLYVDSPGHGTGRINTAHFWGESGAAGQGPHLAMRTVEARFGIPVHHYVRVDFDGFRAIVDAVDGVDVTVADPVIDDAYPTDDYGTIRIEIPAGRQHMDGETALRYARSRHGSSDFARTERQQQIVVALAARLLEPQMVSRWPEIYRIIQQHVDTDLTASELTRLAPTLQRVGAEGIDRYAIGQELTQPWTTPTGGSVLLPIWERIGPLVQDVFTP